MGACQHDFMFPFDSGGQYIKELGYFRDPEQKPICRKEKIERIKNTLVNNISIETVTVEEVVVFWLPATILLKEGMVDANKKVRLERFGFEIG